MKYIPFIHMMRMVVYMLGVVADKEEEQYYYYYESDVEEVETNEGKGTVDVNIAELPPKARDSLPKYGFINENESNPPIDTELWGSEAFLDHSMGEYGCLLRRDTETKRAMLNAADIAERERELRSGDPTDEGDAIADRILEVATNIATPLDSREAIAMAEAETEAEMSGMDAAERADWLKKMPFRRRTAVLMEQKHAARAKAERARELYSLGASCESRACTSCRIVAEEFGAAVFAAVSDPLVLQVGDLAGVKFCNLPQIYLKYGAQVYDVCRLMMRDNGYRWALVTSFEQADQKALALLEAQKQQAPANPRRYWDFIADYLDEYLFLRQEQVCVGIGACGSADLGVNTEARARALEQQSWNVSCFVCQAAIRDIEVRVFLAAELNTITTDAIIAETCSHLVGSVPTCICVIFVFVLEYTGFACCCGCAAGFVGQIIYRGAPSMPGAHAGRCICSDYPLVVEHARGNGTGQGRPCPQ